MAKINEDVAVIKETVRNIEGTVSEIKRFIEDCDKRITATEIKASAVDQRISILTVFQTSFAIVVGAIASYLGGKR